MYSSAWIGDFDNTKLGSRRYGIVTGLGLGRDVLKKSWWKWALGVFGVLIVVSILVDDPEQDAEATAKPVPRIVLDVSAPPAVVRTGSVEVSGTVVPARAIVEVGLDNADAEQADVGSDGEFTARVDLNDLGENGITTSARLGGRRAVSVRIVVERQLSPAEIAEKRERLRERRAAAARERERREAARIARAERRAAKQAAAEERRAAREAAEAEAESEASSGCDPNYSGCVPIASDVDCEGGSGDGPAYTGIVTVTGSDIYDLDSDSDGTACE